MFICCCCLLLFVVIFEQKPTSNRNCCLYTNNDMNSFIIIHINADKRCRFIPCRVWKCNRMRGEESEREGEAKSEQKYKLWKEFEISFAFEWHSRNTCTLNKLQIYSLDRTKQNTMFQANEILEIKVDVNCRHRFSSWWWGRFRLISSNFELRKVAISKAERST